VPVCVQNCPPAFRTDSGHTALIGFGEQTEGGAGKHRKVDASRVCAELILSMQLRPDATGISLSMQLFIYLFIYLLGGGGGGGGL